MGSNPEMAMKHFLGDSTGFGDYAKMNTMWMAKNQVQSTVKTQ